MSSAESRRDELILAAASGSLASGDQAELEALRVVDPGVDEEIAALSQVLARLVTLDGWDDAEPPAHLHQRVTAAIDAVRDGDELPRRRWRVALVAASAVLVAGVVGGTLLVGGGQDETPAQVGALGVTERLQVADVSAGVTLKASVVPHRWGTEAIVEADGLVPGREYDLVVVEDDGVEVPAGGFLGSRQTVHCHLNAPAMRQDLTLLQVRDVSGTVVGWARLPQTSG